MKQRRSLKLEERTHDEESKCTQVPGIGAGTAETKPSVFDTLTVPVRDSTGAVLQTLATFSNVNAAPGYQQYTFDLSGHIGQTVQIFFKGSEDFELQTSFVLDNTSLLVSP